MSACCMVFDESGNAFDAFDWTPEELEAAARRCAGTLTVTVTAPEGLLISVSSSLEVWRRDCGEDSA